VCCDLLDGMSTAQSSTRSAVLGIVALSAVAIAFLFWLLYVHQAPKQYSLELMFLPALNAVLNGLSATCLCIGLYLIKQGQRQAHRAFMTAAFLFSSLFLVSYIVHHALHGDTLFPHIGAMRTIYLSILASHILLSIVALPMVLTTFYFALSGRFTQHKKLARFTFPIWLYVSVTGVVVYALLRAYAY